MIERSANQSVSRLESKADFIHNLVTSRVDEMMCDKDPACIAMQCNQPKGWTWIWIKFKSTKRLGFGPNSSCAIVFYPVEWERFSEEIIRKDKRTRWRWMGEHKWRIFSVKSLIWRTFDSNQMINSGPVTMRWCLVSMQCFTSIHVQRTTCTRLSSMAEGEIVAKTSKSFTYFDHYTVFETRKKVESSTFLIDPKLKKIP